MQKKYKYSLLILFVLSFMVAGCMQPVRPDTVFVPPQEKPQPAAGSIWQGESDKSMLFTDKKARYVNDIVTIIVSEIAAGGNKASANTSRNTNTAASITSLLGIENEIIGSNANLNGKIGLEGAAANSLKGAGDTSRNTSLTAKISARVIRVLDNGNLVIEGRRQVTVNADDQFILITGIIRPEDITTENTVASQYVADARILYTGEGIINDKMRPGWLTRVVDWVWPF
ncbi:MAG: flagellar basal body L-ring protein FlgH [Deltaproteobacteria bacterium]